MPQVDAAIGEGHVYSVSEITSRIKTLIEGRFPDLWIVGEVSNCTHHSSGHTYFTLKDERAQISCVLFAGNARRVTLKLKDGLKVYAQGRVTVYEKQGRHQGARGETGSSLRRRNGRISGTVVAKKGAAPSKTAAR